MPSVSTVQGGYSANNIVCPLIGMMGSTGAAEFDVLSQNTVDISSVDYKFEWACNDAAAEAFLKAFNINNTRGPTGANLFNVDVSDKPALAAFLMEGVEKATGEYPVGHNGNLAENNTAVDVSCQEILRNLLWTGLQQSIATDSLADSLEDLDAYNVEVSLDASGGASQLSDALSVANEEAQLWRNLLYTQIPRETINLYIGLTSGSSSAAGSPNEDGTQFLPLKKGDKFTFVFDVNMETVNAMLNGVNRADGVALNDGRGGETTVDAGNGGQNVTTSFSPEASATNPTEATAAASFYTAYLHYTVPIKRCAFEVTLGDGTVGDPFNLS